jgi:uncharacterized membrane protein YkvA (DUF1232 family)
VSALRRPRRYARGYRSGETFGGVFAALAVGYAFSPIDWIPDPLPILGYPDDLVLIPLGAALAIKMIPKNVLAECREKARQASRESKPVNRLAAAAVVAMCLALAMLAIFTSIPFV